MSSLLSSLSKSINGTSHYSVKADTISSIVKDCYWFLTIQVSLPNSPAISNSTGAISGFTWRSEFRLNFKLAVALSTLVQKPLKASSSLSTAYSMMPAFQKQFTIAYSLTSSQDFLSIILPCKTKIQHGSLSLFSVLMIFT